MVANHSLLNSFFQSWLSYSSFHLATKPVKNILCKDASLLASLRDFSRFTAVGNCIVRPIPHSFNEINDSEGY